MRSRKPLERHLAQFIIKVTNNRYLGAFHWHAQRFVSNRHKTWKREREKEKVGGTSFQVDVGRRYVPILQTLLTLTWKFDGLLKTKIYLLHIIYFYRVHIVCEDLNSKWVTHNCNRMTDSKYFTTTKKGEIFELKSELNSDKKEKKREAVKKVSFGIESFF